MTASTGATHIGGVLDVSGLMRPNAGLNMSNGKVTADVNGNVHVDGVLDVSGQTSFVGGVNIAGTLDVSGLMRPNAGLNISNGNFTVTASSGATHIGGVLDVSGLMRPNAGLNMSNGVFTVEASSGATHVGGILDVSGLTKLNAGLDVSGGYSKLNGGIKVNDPAFVVTPAGVLFINGISLDDKIGTSVMTSQDISGTLRVALLSTLNGGIDVSGGKFAVAASSGSVHVGGSLDVSGSTHIYGGLDVSGNLDVSGKLIVSDFSYLRGGISVTGINGDFLVSNEGVLYVDGETIDEKISNSVISNQVINGTLQVGLLSFLNGGIDVSSGKFSVDGFSGSVYVDGTLDVSGLTRLNSGLNISNGKVVADVSGNVHVGGVLDVSGQTRLNGDVYIANKSTSGGLLDISNLNVNIRNLVGNSVFTYNNAADEINIESLTGTNLTFPRSGLSQLLITGTDGVSIKNPELTGQTICNGYIVLTGTPPPSGGGVLQVGTYSTIVPEPDIVACIIGKTLIAGNLVVRGTVTSQGTVVSAPVWADISSAINTELGTIGILDVSGSIGATSGVGLPTTAPSNTASGTVNGFAGRYLNSSATLLEVITTLNAVIATQNRIINALRFNKVNGLP